MLRLRLYSPLFLPTLHLDVPIYILCPGISGSERVCFALIASHLFFDLNLSSMHCNHWFLDGNTNPLCQRGHFPPCTKLISIPHHPITPPHLIETAYIFQRQPHFFFVLCICMTRPKLMLAYVKCAAMGDTKWSWQNIIQLTVVPLL